jgi:hypothetical protein
MANRYGLPESEVDLIRQRDKTCVYCHKQMVKPSSDNDRRWMNSKDWKRPRNYKSLDNLYDINNLLPFENNWSLVEEQINES